MIPSIAPSANAEDFLREQRVRCLYSPYYFGKTVLGYRDMVDHLHQHDLELFVTRWSEGVRKQFVEWPRAFFKTTTFTVTTSIWVTLPVTDADSEFAIDHMGIDETAWFKRVSLHDQDATQLLAFESIENAKRKVGIIKYHFEENQLFRALFPEIAYSGTELPWNNQSLRIRRVGMRQKDTEGTFDATGVGVAIQSRHYSIVWEDDLVGEKARNSEKVMSDTIGWHGRLAGCFEDPGNQTRFGVSNRWGYADLNSYIRDNEPDFVFYTRAAWELDSESGQLISIFPERYSMERLLSIRDSGSMTDYDFSCQYLNSPTLPGQQEVDFTKFHWYTVASSGDIHCSCGGKYRASQMLRFMRYDPYNAKGSGSKSCPAIVILGTTSDKHIFVLDIYTAKENYSKIFDRLYFFNDVWRPCEFTYEDVGHQNAIEHHIRTIQGTAEFTKVHRRFPRIEGVKTGNQLKEVRIRQNLLPLIEQGKFAMRKGKCELMESQFKTFPFKRLDNDYDVLDACSQNAQRLRFPETQEDFDRSKVADDEYLLKFNTPFSHAGVL